MKDKLSSLLGSAGVVLYFIVSWLVYIMPFIMIGTSFWLNLLFLGLLQFFPAASIIFWVWGLIATIKGVQDLWAIIYYLLFAILFLPFFIGVVFDFISAASRHEAKGRHHYHADSEDRSRSAKKGIIRIVIGIILIILQLTSIVGNSMAGTAPVLPAVSLMQSAYDLGFYLSYYFVGIIGFLLLVSGLCAYYNIHFFRNKKSSDPHAIIITETQYSEKPFKQSHQPVNNTWFTWIIPIVSVCVISFCLVQILNYQQTIEELESTIAEQNHTIEAKNQFLKRLVSESQQYRSQIGELNATLYFYEKNIVFISNNDPKHYHIYGCSLFDRTDPFWACNTERTKQYAITPCEECCK